MKVEGTLHTELLKPEIFNQDAFIGSSSLLYFYKCLECNITLSLFLRPPVSYKGWYIGWAWALWTVNPNGIEQHIDYFPIPMRKQNWTNAIVAMQVEA